MRRRNLEFYVQTKMKLIQIVWRIINIKSSGSQHSKLLSAPFLIPPLQIHPIVIIKSIDTCLFSVCVRRKAERKREEIWLDALGGLLPIFFFLRNVSIRLSYWFLIEIEWYSLSEREKTTCLPNRCNFHFFLKQNVNMYER
jgi:hypothetical protein